MRHPLPAGRDLQARRDHRRRQRRRLPGKTLHLPCAATAFVAKTLPCASCPPLPSRLSHCRCACGAQAASLGVSSVAELGHVTINHNWITVSLCGDYVQVRSERDTLPFPCAPAAVAAKD